MITVDKFDVNFWTFPAGERGVKITPQVDDYANIAICMDFESSNDLIDLILVSNALREMVKINPILNTIFVLYVPYFPYARQDRVMTEGESFSLKAIVDVIKLCKFDFIKTNDAHSSVLAGMFPAGVFLNVPQHEGLGEILTKFPIKSSQAVFISPDAGATKKIYPLAKEFGVSVVEASKVRDPSNGQILSTKIDMTNAKTGQIGIIIDDIIDGGRTFIELAKAMRETKKFRKIILVATHGIFSKGLAPLNDIDEIYVFNHIGKYVTPRKLKNFNSRK